MHSVGVRTHTVQKWQLEQRLDKDIRNTQLWVYRDYRCNFTSRECEPTASSLGTSYLLFPVSCLCYIKSCSSFSASVPRFRAASLIRNHRRYPSDSEQVSSHLDWMQTSGRTSVLPFQIRGIFTVTWSHISISDFSTVRHLIEPISASSTRGHICGWSIMIGTRLKYT